MPFSKEEIKNFKEKGFKKITCRSVNYETIYYFNVGQLFLEKNFLVEKKKGKEHRRVLDSTIYKYDSNGNLIVSKRAGHTGGYDSLAYDPSGRVIYYLSYDVYTQKKNKIVIQLNYKLVPEKSDAYSTTFINKVDTFYIDRYVYNPNNEIIRTNDDSLAKIVISPTEHSIKYLYKPDTSSKYMLGQEFFYKNNKLVQCNYHERSYNYSVENFLLEYKTERYLYNENGHVVQKSVGDYPGKKEVYFYNTNGLLSEKYIMYREKLDDYIQYFYTRN